MGVRQRHSRPSASRATLPISTVPPSACASLICSKHVAETSWGFVMPRCCESPTIPARAVSSWWGDVAHVEGPDAAGVGVLHIPSSKTDQAKEGAQAYLSRATMAVIARWRAVGGIEWGPLLRRVVMHFDGSIHKVGAGRLHPNSIGLIYKRLVRSAWDDNAGGRSMELRFKSGYYLRAVLATAQRQFGIALKGGAAWNCSH
jgi:hypothetical protein